MTPVRVALLDGYRPAPGRLVEFVRSAATRAAAEEAAPSPVPPSFNQLFHLATADRDPEGPRHWLCCAFDLPGAVDLDALHRAFAFFTARHEGLRSGFRARRGPDGAPAGVDRFVLPAETYELAREDHGEPATPEELRELLRARLAARCHPLGEPPHLLSAIVRPGSATVFCGFDHGNTDGWSLALAVHELGASYAAFAAGRTPELPPAGSFVDYCAEEQAALGARPPGPEDPLLAGWADFFAGCGDTLPAFPLDLGVAPGSRAPQGSELRRLLGPEAAGTFEDRCRAHGGTFFTGALTAFALAARRLGAEGPMRLVSPLHTRHEDRWALAMGWFTTVAPLTLDVTAAEGAAAGSARTKEAFAAGRRLAGVPVAQVLPALGDRVRRARDDVFMVSYLDYRRLPGSEGHTAADAHQIVGATTADEAQFWFTRTHEGLFLRARYPGTDRAAAVVHRFTEAVRGILEQESGAEDAAALTATA
ncbi:condensation domain-containing protein [Streptomyces physcomitrii]|uniref:Non-ribosomal peptide synthetase n=1 Tax=Streptomyces physcomitrii TaxID=2724184 RepID=A0ABX1HBL5_9ACTN|nr:condensation domain-containing protein [Streptomyces physcomitrii]NKI44710.1 non-ribosomal peptide synthetase [Streptomyces physcomitrii]